MIREGHITVKTYGGLSVSDHPMFSGGGTEPPPKPKKKQAPKKPKK